MDHPEMIAALEETGHYRVLRNIDPLTLEKRPDEGQYRNGLFIDVETTGLDYQSDKIIEAAFVPFLFDSDGEVFNLGADYHGFNDPGMPIPAEICALTGIYDENVRGNVLNGDLIKVMAENADLCVAYNANFDRKFVEKHLDFPRRPWACAMNEIPWKLFGADSLALSSVLAWQGFYHSGHRAVQDCRASVKLLARTAPDDRSFFSHMVESARKTTLRVWATGSPFAAKDQLKARRYKWSDGSDGRYKAWWVEIPEADLAAEMVWLESDVYKGRPIIHVEKITAWSRYAAEVKSPAQAKEPA